MAERMVSMEVRLAIAAFCMVDNGEASVTAVCDQLGVSRDTFYRYRARFENQGWLGLLPRSSRPHSSPGRTPPAMVALIVAMRARLTAEGWDAGARSIHARLSRQGVEGLPTPRTVHRVLARAGLVAEQPAKRPRSSFTRFEHPHPNSCWQLDGTGWHLKGGNLVCILRLVDDHSRMILASLAAPAETTTAAWACLETAIARHGVPAMLLSDGGSAFTGRRHGRRSGLSDFEARARALGINTVVSSPFHPQTCGKKERDWQPLKRWLNAQPVARTLKDLQQLLDAYDVLFNTERPHQSLGNQTPAERYTASPKADASDRPTSPPCQITHPLARDRGRIELGNGYRLCIGPEWNGVRVTVVRDGLDVVVLHDAQIIVRHRIDPTRKHQLSGRPKGRAHKGVASETS
jgi:transposase InsO family protein